MHLALVFGRITRGVAATAVSLERDLNGGITNVFRSIVKSKRSLEVVELFMFILNLTEAIELRLND